MQTSNISSAPCRQRWDKYIAPFLKTAAFLSLLLFSQKGLAQNRFDYDDISISVSVESLGATEIPALIKSQVLYLSVPGVFDFLKINYHVSAETDSISGFFLRPQDVYLIDEEQHRIVFQDKSFSLDPQDLIFKDGQLYLNSVYFGVVFGLQCVYNLHTLSATIKSKAELPVVRSLHLEQKQSKIHAFDDGFVADKKVGSQFRLLHFNAADWSINALQQLQGPDYTRLGLALGGVVAGGEFKTILTHTTNQPFSEKRQYYLWRYANNDHKALRQITLGKISVPAISTLYDPIVGVQITNAPTYSRKAYGSYTYSGYVQPNWVVELYVNNAFVAYLKSDAVGFITYNIPLAYGSTEVKTRYIGPWGEEHSYTQNFMVPFTVLPANEVEYKVSAGVVEDSVGSMYAQARLNYGITAKMTVGAGVEYLTSVSKVSSLPFLNTSVRLSTNMLLSGEYVYGVRYKGLLTYQLPNRAQFELQYSKYDQEQEAVKYSYDEERKAMISMPFHSRSISGLARMAFNQHMTSSKTYNSLELLVSMAAYGANVNLTTFAFHNSNSSFSAYSNIGSSIKIRGGILFSPKASFDYNSARFTSLNLGFTKYFSRVLSANLAYEQRFDFRERYFRAGFKYDFSFARVIASINNSKEETSFFQSASGSMLYEKKLGCQDFTKNSNIGRGGVIFLAFLDMNGNGKKEMFEPVVKGLNIKMNGSGKRTIQNDCVTVTGLEPYIHYNVLLDGNGLENVAWKLTETHLNITIDPNQIKEIDIPVVSMGEVSGTVFLKDKNGQDGLGRINVLIYDNQAHIVATVLTEEDGYFTYLGLKPGRYSIKLDPLQLNHLGLTSNLTAQGFIIHGSRDGDMVENLKFILGKTGK